jgi:hypothetical protein
MQLPDERAPAGSPLSCGARPGGRRAVHRLRRCTPSGSSWTASGRCSRPPSSSSARSRPVCRGTSLGTSVSESQLISEHLSTAGKPHLTCAEVGTRLRARCMHGSIASIGPFGFLAAENSASSLSDERAASCVDGIMAAMPPPTPPRASECVGTLRWRCWLSSEVVARPATIELKRSKGGPAISSNP